MHVGKDLETVTLSCWTCISWFCSRTESYWNVPSTSQFNMYFLGRCSSKLVGSSFYSCRLLAQFFWGFCDISILVWRLSLFPYLFFCAVGLWKFATFLWNAINLSIVNWDFANCSTFKQPPAMLLIFSL